VISAEAISERIGVGVVLRCLLASAAVLLFCSCLDSYAFVAYEAPRPSHWVVGLIGVAAALLVVHPHRRAPLLKSPLLLWAVLYFAITTVWAIGWARSGPQTTQITWDRYRSTAFLLACAVLFDQARARSAGTVAVAAVVAFSSLLNVAETVGLFKPVGDSFGTEGFVGRSSGLYGNPNASGTAIVLGIVLAAEAVPKTLRVPLLAAAALGVVATLSRGAELCLALAFLLLLWRRALGRWPVVAAAAVAVASIVYSVQVLESHALLEPEHSARLRFAKDDSGRGALALKAWELFLDEPIRGHGLGATLTWDADASSHNMFLNLAGDHGILGLLLFPALGAAIIAANRRSAPFAGLLMVTGLFSHNLLDDRYSLLLVALAASAGSAEPGGLEASEGRHGAGSSEMV